VGQGCEGCGSQAELISSFPPETGAAETEVLPPSVPTSPRIARPTNVFAPKKLAAKWVNYEQLFVGQGDFIDKFWTQIGRAN
jgi:hypothetical protein